MRSAAGVVYSSRYLLCLAVSVGWSRVPSWGTSSARPRSPYNLFLLLLCGSSCVKYSWPVESQSIAGPPAFAFFFFFRQTMPSFRVGSFFASARCLLLCFIRTLTFFEQSISSLSTGKKVRFRMLVFRPFVGEILAGKVSCCNKQGIKVGCGILGGGRHPAADYEARQLPYLTVKIVEWATYSCSSWTCGEEMLLVTEL